MVAGELLETDIRLATARAQEAATEALEFKGPDPESDALINSLQGLEKLERYAYLVWAILITDAQLFRRNHTSEAMASYHKLSIGMAAMHLAVETQDFVPRKKTVLGMKPVFRNIEELQQYYRDLIEKLSIGFYQAKHEDLDFHWQAGKFAQAYWGQHHAGDPRNTAGLTGSFCMILSLDWIATNKAQEALDQC